MEYNLTADRDFFISSIGGIRDVSDLLVAEDTFNNNLKLSDFGTGVKRITFFVFEEFKFELDKVIDQIRPKIKDFDFELFKADILHFAERLRVAA